MIEHISHSNTLLRRLMSDGSDDGAVIITWFSRYGSVSVESWLYLRTWYTSSHSWSVIQYTQYPQRHKLEMWWSRFSLRSSTGRLIIGCNMTYLFPGPVSPLYLHTVYRTWERAGCTDCSACFCFPARWLYVVGCQAHQLVPHQTT